LVINARLHTDNLQKTPARAALQRLKIKEKREKNVGTWES